MCEVYLTYLALKYRVFFLETKNFFTRYFWFGSLINFHMVLNLIFADKDSTWRTKDTD